MSDLRYEIQAEVAAQLVPITDIVKAAELNSSRALQAAYRAEAAVDGLPGLIDRHFSVMKDGMAEQFAAMRADIKTHDATIRRVVMYERAAMGLAGLLGRTVFSRSAWAAARRLLGVGMVVITLAGALYVLSMFLS